MILYCQLYKSALVIFNNLDKSSYSESHHNMMFSDYVMAQSGIEHPTGDKDRVLFRLIKERGDIRTLINWFKEKFDIDAQIHYNNNLISLSLKDLTILELLQ